MSSRTAKSTSYSSPIPREGVFPPPKHMVGTSEIPYLWGFKPYCTPEKLARKGAVSYTLLRFLDRCPPLTRYAWAGVLSLQFFKIVPPLCPSTCPPTSHYSSILVPGAETRTFPYPPPSNAIRTPFKRGRNIKPTDALNAHIQRIYPHTDNKGHTRKHAAPCA